MHSNLSTALLIAVATLTACKPSPNASPETNDGRAAKPQVLVANYPLQFFAERLGGAAIEVKFPAPGDEDPAFWQPDDAAIAVYQEADLILMNGATYSKWAEKASLPASKIVDTSAPFKSEFIEIKAEGTHSHGPGGEHSHSGTAFTTWLDFQQALQQAQAVRQALTEKWPGLAEQIEKNFQSLHGDLLDLDSRMLQVGKSLDGAQLVASHPVYHYWARRYGINLQPVLWEPETVPDDEAMDELKKILAGHPAKWMVWEGDPAPESVAKLEAIGVKSVVFDPCGNVPEEGDFVSVMRANVEAMEAVAKRVAEGGE